MNTSIEILGSQNQVIAIMRVKVLKNVFKPVTPPAAPRKAEPKDKIVLHTDVRNKWEVGKELTHEYNAEINLTKKTIRVYGFSTNYDRNSKKIRVDFNRTFKVGDLVEYGSYNLTYTDPIGAITEKGVKINHNSRNSIMKIGDFINRNWDLDLAKIKAHNAAWMD
jgi:hypothetical protein